MKDEFNYSWQIAPSRYSETIQASDLTEDTRTAKGANAIRNNTAGNLVVSYENEDGTRDSITLLPLETIPFVPHTLRASGSGVNDASGWAIQIFYIRKVERT